jgi:hypothetical protein
MEFLLMRAAVTGLIKRGIGQTTRPYREGSVAIRLML